MPNNNAKLKLHVNILNIYNKNNIFISEKNVTLSNQSLLYKYKAKQKQNLAIFFWIEISIHNVMLKPPQGVNYEN